MYVAANTENAIAEYKLIISCSSVPHLLTVRYKNIKDKIKFTRAKIICVLLSIDIDGTIV